MLKGLCRGSFKYISQIFVVKEREMEIGCPTDVKHVAHIGWDGRDGTTPSWMSEFDRVSDLTMESIGSFGGSRDQSWTSQDFERTYGRQTSSSAKLSNFGPTNLATATDSKKSRRKKTQSTNSSTPKRSSKISCKPRFMQRGSEEGDTMWSTVHL